MSDLKPGDIRLWRMRKHLGEWTLKAATIEDAVVIIDALVRDGFEVDLQVQQFGEDGAGGFGWFEVPADDLDVARAERRP